MSLKLFSLGLLAAAALFGAEERELKDSAGATVIRYVVEAPAGVAPAGTADPARQLGLILCFPEHDRPTGDELLPVRESLRRQGLLDGYVLVAGHPQGQKFGAADIVPIEKLIAWAVQTYPVNPRRIYMYGKGEGGKITGEFATAHPQLVTAGISYSWGWWNMPSELTQPIDFEKTAPEFYMVLGMRDLSHHITTVRDTYGRVSAKGYHVIYREIDDLGARTYHPPSNDDALAWATRLRNKNIAPSPAEMTLLQKPVRKDGYYPALALVGGAPAGAVVRKLLRSADAAERAAAAETCAWAIFDEETTAALRAAAADSAPLVRRAALHALALNAQWRSAAAQKILIELALNGTERVSAVDAIGQAVRMQVRGFRQDPPLFQTLVALLTDQNEELRTMAANILAPIRDGDFRGDLGRPERKAPEGGWSQWLAGIQAKAAGYQQDYEVCQAPSGGEAQKLYCQGGDIRQRFQNTLQAAELGYVPAQAAVGMLYANGKGVEQNYAEAGKWWALAAQNGHQLAKVNYSMVPKRPAPAAPKPK